MMKAADYVRNSLIGTGCFSTYSDKENVVSLIIKDRLSGKDVVNIKTVYHGDEADTSNALKRREDIYEICLDSLIKGGVFRSIERNKELRDEI
jgi:hypothetical protein